MLSLGHSSLRFLGSRDYAHSTDVFRAFYEGAQSHLSATAVPKHLHTFKFFRPVRHGGEWLLTDENALSEVKPAAEIEFSDERCRRRAIFIEDTDLIPTRSPEPAELAQMTSWAGRFAATLCARELPGVAELFRALVQSNKAVHVRTLEEEDGLKRPSYQFVYAENIPLSFKGGETHFVVSPLSEQRVGARIFTLNKIDVSTSGYQAHARLCFAYDAGGRNVSPA